MAQELSLKEQNEVLKVNRNFIVDNLDPDDVIDELIQNHLISENAAQKVTQPMGWSKEEKNRTIIDQLSTSGPGAVKKFCEIIRRKKRQLFIVEKLEKCKNVYICDQAWENRSYLHKIHLFILCGHVSFVLCVLSKIC